MSLAVVVDRTPVIRASLHDVERTLAISVLLVILVVFFFLRDVRATLIPSRRSTGVLDQHVRRHVPHRVQSR